MDYDCRLIFSKQERNCFTLSSRSFHLDYFHQNDGDENFKVEFSPTQFRLHQTTTSLVEIGGVCTKRIWLELWFCIHMFHDIQCVVAYSYHLGDTFCLYSKRLQFVQSKLF